MEPAARPPLGLPCTQSGRRLQWLPLSAPPVSLSFCKICCRVKVKMCSINSMWRCHHAPSPTEHSVVLSCNRIIQTSCLEVTQTTFCHAKTARDHICKCLDGSNICKLVACNDVYNSFFALLITPHTGTHSWLGRHAFVFFNKTGFSPAKMTCWLSHADPVHAVRLQACTMSPLEVG